MRNSIGRSSRGGTVRGGNIIRGGGSAKGRSLTRGKNLTKGNRGGGGALPNITPPTST